jgi:SWI/SNF-related matrix-associated actin-dependent regulator 1 of chromatin subfamily A
LKQKISKYFLRRRKEDVLAELPPKNRIEVPIELPNEEHKQYELAEENLVKYLKTYKKEKTDKEIAKSLAGEKLVKLNVLRLISSMGKIPTVKELIQNIIDSDEKVIVFSCFNAPLEELSEDFEENSVILLGNTPVDEREALVNKFQEDPNTKIFFTGIKSGGTGITLTAASNEIFIDLSWNPADHQQAEGRAHRPGAIYESLNIYQIISRNTIDGFMIKLLKRKQEIFDKLIEGNEVESEKGMIDEYLQTLQAKHNIK